jgi:hypothetical protein
MYIVDFFVGNGFGLMLLLLSLTEHGILSWGISLYFLNAKEA